MVNGQWIVNNAVSMTKFRESYYFNNWKGWDCHLIKKKIPCPLLIQSTRVDKQRKKYVIMAKLIIITASIDFIITYSMHEELPSAGGMHRIHSNNKILIFHIK